MTDGRGRRRRGASSADGAPVDVPIEFEVTGTVATGADVSFAHPPARRRREIAIVAGLVVIVLIVLVVRGNQSGPSATPATTTTSTTEPPTDPSTVAPPRTTAAFGTIPTVAPTTTVAATPTLTLEPSPPILPATQGHLYVLELENGLRIIDAPLEGGTRRTWWLGTPKLGDGGQQPQVFPVDQGIVAAMGLQVWYLPERGRATVIRAGASNSASIDVRPAADPRSVWVHTYDNQTGVSDETWFRIALDGKEQEQLNVANAELLADTPGGLWINAPGGLYRRQPDGSFRVVYHGSVAFRTGDYVTMVRCDDRLTCVNGRVHLTDGTFSALPDDGGGYTNDVVWPDGKSMFHISYQGGAGSVGTIVNLVDGTSRPLDYDGDVSVLVGATFAGQWALYLDQGSLKAIDRNGHVTSPGGGFDNGPGNLLAIATLPDS